MKHGYAALLAISLGVAGTTPVSAAAPAPETTVMGGRHHYPSDHAEGRSVLDWVAAHSPDRAPMGRGGTVTVEKKSRFAGPARAATDTHTPPGDLPGSGHPAGPYNVEHTLSDGTHQRWSFRWVEASATRTGRWDLASYSYRRGTGLPAATR